MDEVWKKVWMRYGISMEESMEEVWNKYGISTEYPGRYFLLEIFFEIFIFSIFFFEISKI